MSEVEVNLIKVEFDEIVDRIDIDLSCHETIIEKDNLEGKCISIYLFII